MAEATASGTSTGLTSSSVVAQETKPATSARRDYKGFVAGVFSGIAKLTGMLFVFFFFPPMYINLLQKHPFLFFLEAFYVGELLAYADETTCVWWLDSSFLALNNPD